MEHLYELVVVLHPQLSKDEQTAITQKIDTLLGAGKKATDDMGLVQLAHTIGKAQLSQVYMLSYHCSLPTSALATIKKELTLTKGVVRHVVFSMGAHEVFHSFADLNKQFEKPEAPADGKKPEMMIRKGYFNKPIHNTYVSWKAVKLLTYYMTRFAEIKPRRFMGNSVSQQKKVRQAILRARELGVMGYKN